MRQRTTATSQLPEYIYMPLGDGSADVFIYKFISYDDENDEYEYETNEFRSWTVTEDEIKANPFIFLDYDHDEAEKAEPKNDDSKIMDDNGNVYEQYISTEGTIMLKLVESYTGELFE